MAIMSRGTTMNKLLIAVIALAVIIDQVDVAMAVNCDIAFLLPCLPVIQDPSQQPTPECCTHLVIQQPCLCVYARDPRYKAYVNSPGAKKLVATCRIQPPQCS